jgi:hypothetical protein
VTRSGRIGRSVTGRSPVFRDRVDIRAAWAGPTDGVARLDTGDTDPDHGSITTGPPRVCVSTPSKEKVTMSAQNPPPREPGPEREREVIVTNGGGGAGTAVAVIVGVIVLVVLLFVLFGGGFGGGADDGGDVVEAPEAEVDVPDEVDVEVDAPEGE